MLYISSVFLTVQPLYALHLSFFLSFSLKIARAWFRIIHAPHNTSTQSTSRLLGRFIFRRLGVSYFSLGRVVDNFHLSYRVVSLYRVLCSLLCSGCLNCLLLDCIYSYTSPGYHCNTDCRLLAAPLFLCAIFRTLATIRYASGSCAGNLVFESRPPPPHLSSLALSRTRLTST